MVNELTAWDYELIKAMIAEYSTTKKLPESMKTFLSNLYDKVDYLQHQRLEKGGK